MALRNLPLFARMHFFLAILAASLLPTTLPVYAACSSSSFSTTTVDGGNYAPNSVRFGDIDGDTDKDIVTGSAAAAGDLYYYLNNGSGTYAAGVGLSSTQESQYQIELSDIDGDGDLDIVSADRYGENIAWYENNGGLSFTQRSIASGLATDSVYDIAVGDLDGDTDIDVLAAIGGTTDDVAWYRNNGNDTFTTMTAVDSNLPGASMLDAADIDGDTDIDVLAVSAELGGGASYYLNNGSGSFTETSLTTSPRANGRIVDMDSDGDKDLLVIAQNALYWYANSGGSFGGATTIGSGSYLFIGLATADIDGDGDMDFATSEYSNAGSSWWKNNGSQSFSEQIISATGYLYDIAIAEATGDANNDIVVAAQNPNNDILLYVQACDTTAPTVSSFSPTDGATNVSTTANLVLTFDETVTVQSGNITIKKTSDNATFETIAITSGLVTGTGTTTITVNPSGTFTEQTGYYVQIDATAFDDASGNGYAGIADSTTWNFTVGDFTSPTLSALSPLDDASAVSRTTTLTITFTEAVTVGTGNIIIKRSSDDVTIETIDVTGGQITGGGTATIVIDPTTMLNKVTDYYVQIDATAFDDASGNGYAGINDTTTWSFTTIGGGSTVAALTAPRDFHIRDVIARLDDQHVLLTWSSGKDVQLIHIDISIDDGTSWTPVAYAVANLGSYLAEIRDHTPGSTAIFRVASTDNLLILSTATSNAVTFMPSSSSSAEDERTAETLSSPSTSALPQSGPSPVDGNSEEITALAPGMYVKAPSFSTVYYINERYERLVFLDAQTYFTYEEDFSPIVTITDATLPMLPLAGIMPPKPGTVLLKIPSSAIVYELDTTQQLHILASEEIAAARYGEHWNSYVIDLDPVVFGYIIRRHAPTAALGDVPPRADMKTRAQLALVSAAHP